MCPELYVIYILGNPQQPNKCCLFNYKPAFVLETLTAQPLRFKCPFFNIAPLAAALMLLKYTLLQRFTLKLKTINTVLEKHSPYLPSPLSLLRHHSLFLFHRFWQFWGQSWKPLRWIKKYCYKNIACLLTCKYILLHVSQVSFTHITIMTFIIFSVFQYYLFSFSPYVYLNLQLICFIL